MLLPRRLIGIFVMASLAMLMIGTQQPAYAPPKADGKPAAGSKKPIDRSQYNSILQVHRQAAAQARAAPAATNNAAPQQIRIPPAQSGYTAASSSNTRQLAQQLPSPPGVSAPAARATNATYGKLQLKPKRPPMRRIKRAPTASKPAVAPAGPRTAVLAVRPLKPQAQAPATATSASTARPRTNAQPSVRDTVNRFNANGVILAPRSGPASNQKPAKPPKSSNNVPWNGI